jgi:ATP-dependent RNA helicase HelY
MDKHVAIGNEVLADIQAFGSRYSFPLDVFQIEAMHQLAQGQSVLVAAPTGTGKTLVAEYAIWLAQQRQQRVIYTTPLKALSNQKYRDLRKQYGNDTVGLVTGDIVEHSRAPIVIMTTEVYRNMLLEEGGEPLIAGERAAPASLQDTGFVVFDELHYLSDIGRGPVWEEAIICSPSHVQLVGLSATISNAEDLANWISRVHRPISLIIHEQRAVPLEHYYFLDGKLHLVQDADGNRIERFPDVGGEAKLAQTLARSRPLPSDDDDNDDDDDDIWQQEYRNKKAKNRQQQEKPADPETTHDSSATDAATASETQTITDILVQPSQKPKRPKPRKAPEPGEILTVLREADLLPCLYFLPGRRVVEEAAMSSARHSFTTPAEESLIHEEIDVWLEHLPQEDRNLQQVHGLIRLLPRGLAFHHAGLLPGLKVLVETLFARGYLRAVFATDTLALGINMPARSVVVGSLSKFDGQEMRLLTPNEYRQITGRAGRRGMDVQGAAIIPYSPWEPFEASFQRITGELLPVTSSFVIRYNSVLNLWRSGDTEHLRHICASSLREFQRYVAWEIEEFRRLEKRYQKAKKNGKKKGVAPREAEHALAKRRKKIGAFPLSRAGAAELNGTIFALRRLGYMDQQDQLTLKGQLLSSIFHPAGILLVELIMLGSLDELSANELAEACSWFTYDNDRRLNNRQPLPHKLHHVRRDLWQVTQRVRGIEEHAQINFTPGIVPEFHSLALSWSRGTSLSGLLRRIDLVEGDILMLLNQTIDLIQQVQAAIGHILDKREIWEHTSPAPIDDETKQPANTHNKQHTEQLHNQRERLERLRTLLAQAASSLLHGIIIQSRTVPSMVAHVGEEEVPLDAEEDRDAQGLMDITTFAGDV